MEKVIQSNRIQTSFLNAAEKRILVRLAKLQPRWVTSDMLTAVGVFGAFLTGLGFFLARYGIEWLWLSSAGLLINWYGDSLDGTLARVRNTQRPIYGYYIDHTIDCINEGMMFVGAGLSPFIRLDLALLVYVVYLALTINVSINAHLKGEFRLTYAKLGPTEFRILIVIANTILIAWPSLASMTGMLSLGSHSVTLNILDYVGMAILALLTIIYLATIISDARKYAAIDPLKSIK